MVFGVQGALWGNAMTWWDHDTGSIWSQPVGEAIAGPRKGETVELLPMTFTTWSAWREAHPDTLALDETGGRSGFDLSQMFLVVDFTDEATPYPVPDVRQEGVVNDVVAGLEIAVVIDPTDDRRWAVFSRRLDDRTVTLRVEGAVLVDDDTETTWDPIIGVGLSGELRGEILNRMPALTSFPGDYGTFWPEGGIWSS